MLQVLYNALVNTAASCTLSWDHSSLHAIRCWYAVAQDEGVWVVDEDADEQQVAWTSVLQIVDHVYGQRQDQEHNPHGEHAHDVWQVMITIPEEVYRGNFKLTQ